MVLLFLVLQVFSQLIGVFASAPLLLALRFFILLSSLPLLLVPGLPLAPG
jgi:hypothetical protein